MKNINCLKVLKIFIIILSAIALCALFMPYEKSTEKFREELLDNPDQAYIYGLDFENKDAVNLSVIENFKIYQYAINNNGDIDWIKEEAIINVVITIVLIASIILIMLFAILNKNVLVIIFDLLLGIASLAMNYDIVSRGALPSDSYTYGISYYLFIIIAILILISVIALKVLKKHPELLEKIQGNKTTETTSPELKTDNPNSEDKKEVNNISNMLKKYWYILIIMALLIVIIIILLGNNSNKSNSNNNNNNNSEINDNNNYDKNDNQDSQDNNTSGSTNTNKDGKENNVEYSIFQTLKDESIIIGKNNNEGINDISIEVEFYDKNNKFLGSSSENIDSVSKNAEFAIDLYSAPESYDHYKVFIDVTEDDNYSYNDKLKATSNDTGEKIVGQIENTTDDEIDYMKIAIVYYKDNKVIGYDYTTDSSIKSGRTANFDFYYPYDKNYDDVKFDTYKIFINSAYSYNW